MKLPALVCFALVSYAASVRGASPTIAVMPFHDLSGGKGSIGEAIRETVTSDLRELGGVRVIERANLDKVLAEQSLQAKKDQLDPGSVVLVGKLVGATLIVAGAYQKSGDSVRLTARFVSVETTEIVGTAKVDGSQSDFLKLQDQVTAQLLRSAKMEPKKVQSFAARPRPKVKTLRTIELYGDAVVQTDDTKRLALLKEAVSTDPGFVYASRDLDALEKRIREYAHVAEGAQDAALRDQLKTLDAELAAQKDPLKLYSANQMMFSRLLVARRYLTLVAFCRRILASPPPLPDQLKGTMAEPLDAQAQGWIVYAYEQLKDDDKMLRECDVFLAKYPTSMSFTTEQMRCNGAIDRKRAREAGRAEAAEKIAQMKPEERSNPCYRGVVYKSNNQLVDARRDLEQCMKDGDHHFSPDLPPTLLMLTDYDLGKFRDAHKWLDFVRVNYPDKYNNVRQFETAMSLEE